MELWDNDKDDRIQDFRAPAAAAPHSAGPAREGRPDWRDYPELNIQPVPMTPRPTAPCAVPDIGPDIN